MQGTEGVRTAPRLLFKLKQRALGFFLIICINENQEELKYVRITIMLLSKAFVAYFGIIGLVGVILGVFSLRNILSFRWWRSFSLGTKVLYTLGSAIGLA